MSGKMLKQNAVTSKNVKLKCCKFSALQKREIKLQRKISVLQCWEMLISRSHSKQLLVDILLSATRERAALLALTSPNQTADLNTDG